MNARTGRPLWAVRTPFPDPVIRADVDSRLIVSSSGMLAALQPATGRVLWARRLGFRAGAVARAYGLLWVHSAAFHEPGDRLSGLDPGTGNVATTSILPAFGMTGLVALGRRLVASSAGGRLLRGHAVDALITAAQRRWAAASQAAPPFDHGRATALGGRFAGRPAF
jgi:hypothetical protein